MKVIIPKDNIIFFDIIDTTFSSVDSVYYIPFGPGNPIPVPLDSSAQYKLDLNHDGINDFNFKIQHWYEGANGGNPCSNYKHSKSISGISSGNQIVTTAFHEPLKLNENIKIDSTLFWNNASGISTTFCNINSSNGFNGLIYLGLKIANGPKYIYGWVLVQKLGFDLTIKEMAINLAANNSIKTGQKE